MRFGLPELIIILVIVLLIFGAGRLPALAASMRKAVDAFRRGTADEEPPTKRSAKSTRKDS
jgi:sec-independent protein translocase protein TatA